MKRNTENLIAQRLIALLLILATLTSYFPLYAFATDAGENLHNGKIDIDVNWKSAKELEEGKTSDSFELEYSVLLNQVRTGFQDVTIVVETDKVDGVYDTIKAEGVTNSGNGFASISKGNQPEGTELKGNISINFGNEDAQLTREVTFWVEGSYIGSTGDTIRFREKKVLHALVTPKDVLRSYSSNLYWGLTKQGRYEHAALVEENNKQSFSNGWYATKVTGRYPINIYSGYYTQKMELKVTMSNLDENDDSKLSDGYTIDWDGLDEDFELQSTEPNDDGSITFTFVKGESAEEFNKENTFYIKDEYDIKVEYLTPNTDQRNRPVRGTAKINVLMELESEGFNYSKKWGEEEVISKVTNKERLDYSTILQLGFYTPEDMAWGVAQIGGLKIKTGEEEENKLSDTVIQDLLEKRTAEFETVIQLRFTGGAFKQVDANIKMKNPVLVYKSDAGNIIYKTLTDNQMKIKSISGGGTIPTTIDGVENSTVNDGYVPDSDTKLSTYTLLLEKWLYNYFIEKGATKGGFSIMGRPLDPDEWKIGTGGGHLSWYGPSYNICYELNVDDLGLTDTEIENIISLGVEMAPRGEWMKGTDGIASISREHRVEENKYSYMELELDNSFDTDVTKYNIPENKSLKLKMNHNEAKVPASIEIDGFESRNYVVNENPVFYINLPGAYGRSKQFVYNIDAGKITSSNPNVLSVDTDEINIIAKNGEMYLVIPCKGTYNSLETDELYINVPYKRTLKSKSPASYSINAYMLTDNENYITPVDNFESFSKDAVVPKEVFLESSRFSVDSEKKLSAKASLLVEEERIEPDTSNQAIEDGEKESPYIIDSNEDVTIEYSLQAEKASVEDVVIIGRLPFANNSYIYDETTKLIEDDYELSESFYDEHKGKVKKDEEETAVKQLTMANIRNVKVARINDGNNKEKVFLKDNQYTIYYSTDENADFDSTWTNIYDPETSDLTGAKNIKVEFVEPLQKNCSYVLQYDATMPDQEGMVGAVSSAQYKETEGVVKQLNSPAIYMINGDTSGDLKIQKKFKYYQNGVAPEGLSLENIQFKLQQYNEATGTYEFVQDAEGHDLTATTNDEGIAEFKNLEVGDYYVYEVTEMEGYKGLGLNYVAIERASTTEYIAENLPKTADIIVKKTWSNANETQGKVTFEITRQDATGETTNFGTKTVSTDENDIATLENVPYGTYRISEKVGIDGWTCTESTKTVVLNDTNANASSTNPTVTFNNELAKGSLQIIKTVPEGENVNELSFRIIGRGAVYYTNTSGNVVDTNTDMTIKVGDSTPNVDYNIEDNGAKVTITISNLYFGYYTVEEVEIPQVGTDPQIDKYSPLTGSGVINSSETPVVIRMVNNYKAGYIQINKTASLKDGDEYIDVGDLSGFQVRITGQSYYGTNVNRTITLDENGQGTAKVEIGEYTLTEVAQEGYTTYYCDKETARANRATAPTSPVTVKVFDGKITRQNLYNEHTGKGVIRVEKSLSDVTDPSKIVQEGIEFQIIGQDVVGRRIQNIMDTTIKINKIDTVKNVAYGVSAEIPSGGSYELVETKVPEYYDGMENREIEIKSTEDPIVISVDNERATGDLEMVTTTNPENGPLTGITYEVTEVKINQNGTYTKVGTPTEVEGNNDTINTSFAKLSGISAGQYLVRQLTVPTGWNKDVSQIVEVPSYSVGYANFEITQKKKLQENKVTINKKLLDVTGNEFADRTALESALESAGLNTEEKFEVKITNVETNEEYYVFTSIDEPGVIQGLDVGTYSFEEMYKPKYITEGYYKNIPVVPNVGTVDPGDVQMAEEEIEATDGKYLFTVEADGSTVKDTNITIKNKINTNFGFGGQKSQNNLNKTSTEESSITYVTRTVIFVMDEEGNEISGVKFKLLDKDGNTVTLNNLGNEFEINNKKLTIKGLEKGLYTLVCTQVPTGYVKPDNKSIIVFEDATQVASVEIQKNVPRGNLTLSTVYTTEDNVTKNTPRSKYKIVNKETGELLRFTKTSTGDYKKTNLEDASPVIVLKAGEVEVEGIELGDYEVGLVDVTKGYAIQNTEPKDVTVVKATEEQSTQVVTTEVITKGIRSIDTGCTTTMYLDESGNVYVAGYSSYGKFGTADDGGETNYSSQFRKLDFGADVEIIKFVVNSNTGGSDLVLAIDSEGRVWAWGHDYGIGIGDYTTPTCISNSGALATAYNAGTRFVDVEAQGYGTALLLDNTGKVWARGYYAGDGTSSASPDFKVIQSFVDDNVTISKLGRPRGDSTTINMGVIDSEGKIWMWGPNQNIQGIAPPKVNYTPVCIADNQYSSDADLLKTTVFVDLITTNNFALALDNKGNVWTWGTSGVIHPATVAGKTTIVANKIDSSMFGNSKITAIGAKSTSNANERDLAAVIDEKGRVWTWGVGQAGELGTGTMGGSAIPTCISDDQAEPLYGVKMRQIEFSDVYYSNSIKVSHVVALDENNRIWAWGGFSKYGESGETTLAPNATPKAMNTSYNEHLEYGLKFKEVSTSADSYGYNKFAIDEEGKVWVWGSNRYNSTGIANNRSEIIQPVVLDIPGNAKIKKVSSAPYNTIMLSNDGRVYISGYGYVGNGSKINDYDGIGITEITSNFNLASGTEIVDVFTAKTGGSPVAYYAIASDGTAYSWGENNNNSLGRTDTANDLQIKPILEGINVSKIVANYNYFMALTDSGDIYITQSSTPQKYEVGTKFIDICPDGSRGYALDEDGKLWYVGSSNNMKCVSDDPNTDIYKYYKTNNKYKILKLYEYGNGNIIAEDSGGRFWKVDYGRSITKFNTYGLEIVSLSRDIAVDKYGRLWQFKSTGEVTCLLSAGQQNAGIKNELYDVKIKDIINDKFVIDENDNLWYFVSGGNVVNITDEYSGVKNPLHGKTVKRVINKDYVETTDNEVWYIGGSYPAKVFNTPNFECTYVDESYSSLGYEYYVALDWDGKVYSCGANTSGRLGNGAYTTNGEIVCLNDIEGSELNIANARFDKTYYTGGCIYAIDKSGKVWKLGYYDSNYILSPICITDDETTDLHNAYVDNNVRIVDFVDGISTYEFYSTSSDLYYGARVGDTTFLVDSNGDRWNLDGSKYTRIIPKEANGALLDAYENDENFDIVKQDIIRPTAVTVNGVHKWKPLRLVLGNNNKLYMATGVTWSGEEGTYSEFSEVSNVTDFVVLNTKKSSYDEYTSVAVQSENKIRVFTMRFYLGEYFSCSNEWQVNNIIETALYDKNTSNGKEFYAIDNSGKLYLFGYNSEANNTHTTCYSNWIDPTTAVSGKEIVDLELIKSTYVAEDSEGNLYTWVDDKLPVAYTAYDDIIRGLYGEVNNNNKKDFIRNFTGTVMGTDGTVIKDNKIYKITHNNGTITCEEIKYMEKYLDGMGDFEVVGEYDVKTDDGKIYRLMPTGSGSYTMEEIDSAGAFTSKESDGTVLDGVDVVKQTAHKALDSEGNLYVWGEFFTGLQKYELSDGVVNLTKEQYSSEPVITRGWTVIKNQF